MTTTQALTAAAARADNPATARQIDYLADLIADNGGNAASIHCAADDAILSADLASRWIDLYTA